MCPASAATLDVAVRRLVITCGDRQLDREAAPLALGRGGGRAATVSSGDGLDDRQAEPAAARGPDARAVATVEALEDVLHDRRRDPRAPVGDHEVRRRPVDADLDVHRRARRRVEAGVGDEVGDHLSQPLLVAEHGDGGGLEGDRPVGLDGERVRHGVCGEVVEPDGLALDRSLLVQPGEEEEVLHERAHAVALVRQAAHGLVELAGVPEPPGAPQVGVARIEVRASAARGRRRRRTGGGAPRTPPAPGTPPRSRSASR
jgi:hypothetical protein